TILSLPCEAKNSQNRCVKRYWEIIADNLSKAGWSRQFSAIPRALAGNGRARVNKPFRIDNLSVFLSFVHQAALMIWNERRKRELALLDDSGSNLFRDLLPIRRCQCKLCFDRVGEKTAFNQNSR